jgi:hypothetical protein
MRASSPPPLPTGGRRGGRKGRLPLFASALAWPGAGQFMQGRPLHGIAYAGSFTVFAALLCIFAARHLRPLVGLWLGLPDVPPPAGDTLRPILLTAGLLLFVYLANLYDVWLADFKRSRTDGKAAP